MVNISLTRQEIRSLDMVLGETASRIELTAKHTFNASPEQRFAWEHDAERLRQLARRLTSEMHEREAA